VSIAQPANVASIRVMEKLGFRVVAKRDSEAWGIVLVHALDRPTERSAFPTRS
jgi:RimJ/RimL family protein N-acetyltransferase